MSRNWIFYLEDIIESTRKIRRYTQGLTFDQFQSQDVVFDAVVRNLEIIGEAAKHLPPEGRALMPNVDWPKVAGFRDVIVHGYFGLDVHVIWDMVQSKVPDLLLSVEKALQQLKDQPS
jgi:uncharacterized protein with HEPN domain